MPYMIPLQPMAEQLSAIQNRIVEQLLPPEAILQYAQGKVAHHFLEPYAERLRTLSYQYTEGRAHGSKVRPFSLDDARTYGLYYLLINAAKLLHLFRHVAAAPSTMIDLGAGPGTAALAAHAYFRSLTSVTCIEPASTMRTVGELLTPETTVWSTAAEIPVHARADLVVIANVLNETADGGRTVLDQGLQALNPGGTLIIIEPGTPTATRALMRARDYVIEDSSVTIRFPCSRRSACPMLATPHNWCHFELSWERPVIIQQLDTLTGFNKHRIKYSALVVQRAPQSPPPAGKFRVLSDPVRRPFGREVLLCGPEHYGLVQVRRSERASPDGAALWDARWGELITSEFLAQDKLSTHSDTGG